LIEFFLSNDIN